MVAVRVASIAYMASVPTILRDINPLISLFKTNKIKLFRELNHLPYLLSNSVSLAVIKDFSTNYMMALGLNQAYMLLKLCMNIMSICSFVYITAKTKN